MDHFDPMTGELPPYETLASRALAAAREERRDRRSEAMGVGQVSLYAKLARAYAKIAPVLAKGAEGQRGNYTSLDAVLRAVRPHLLAEGVLIRQGADRVFSMGDGASKSYWTTIYTDLIDADTGQVQRTEMPMPISQPNPQALGGCLTYGRRYTLLAALGIASGEPGEDDDADGAMPRDMRVDSELDELKRELAENETEAEALKWKSAVHKRLQDLSADDFATIKAAFQAHVKALRAKVANGEAPPQTAAKPSKPGPKNRIAPTHEAGSA